MRSIRTLVPRLTCLVLLMMLFLSFSTAASYTAFGRPTVSRRCASGTRLGTQTPKPQRYFQHTIGLSNVLSIRRGGFTASSSGTALDSSLAMVDAFWKSHPLIAAGMVCATKAFLADVVAQRRQQQILANASGSLSAVKFDRRRSLSFIAYGALYQGMVQELIYNNLYTFLFGSATTARVVIKKVLFDAFFHNALVCIPMAYVVKAFVFQNPLTTGIRQYIDDVMNHGLLLKYYVLWMPVNAMIFTIVPSHYRITVMAVVSFFWMIILSTISSRSRDA